jgi:hypothetical protein
MGSSWNSAGSVVGGGKNVLTQSLKAVSVFIVDPGGESAILAAPMELKT